MELNIIVNEQDEIIGYKPRNEITANDIYRVSALWIENSKGEILLAERGFMKQNGPGKWGAAAAGTVEKDESYEDNIYKEVEEEIGLYGYTFEKGPKLFRNMGNRRFFCQWYSLKLDKDISEFTLEENEVEAIRWFRKEEIINLYYNNPHVLTSRDYIQQKYDL